MRYKRIVSIGAHSLDAELQGGPVMIKAAKHGARCTMVHVTSGRLEDPQATESEKQAYLEQIFTENDKAASGMGCDVYRMNYLSRDLPTIPDFIEILKDYFIDEDVDLVISHARGTLHPRHYYCYETVTEAVRQLEAEGRQIELWYGENCEDLAGFSPTKYIPLEEDEVKTWFDSLSSYAIFQGKVNNVPYQSYYQSMLTVRAFEVGSKKPVKAYMTAPHLDNLS